MTGFGDDHFLTCQHGGYEFGQLGFAINVIRKYSGLTLTNRCISHNVIVDYF
jgi:hypothetical protein